MIAVPKGSDLDLDLRMESVVEGVWVSGTVTATAAGQCVRCLDDVQREVEADVQHLYAYPGHVPADADDEDVDELVGDLVDIEPVVRDAVVLALPFQPVCREDCPGLCSECGAHLADDPGHAHEQVDPRWAALRSLTDRRRTTKRTPKTTTLDLRRERTDVAVPKRKTSRSNTRSRRANWKTSAATLTPCPQCRQPKLPHVACPSCGTYDGRHYAAAERTEHQA